MKAEPDRCRVGDLQSFDEAAACHGKPRYCNGAAAYRAAQRLNARKRRGGRGARAHVYKCPHCGGWHFGRSALRMAGG